MILEWRETCKTVTWCYCMFYEWLVRVISNPERLRSITTNLLAHHAFSNDALETKGRHKN